LQWSYFFLRQANHISPTSTTTAYTPTLSRSTNQLCGCKSLCLLSAIIERVHKISSLGYSRKIILIMTPKLHDASSNSSDQDLCSQSTTSSQHRPKESINSSEESCSSSDTDDTPKQHDRSGQRRPTPACPYISTMLGRRHLLHPPVSSKMTGSSSSSSSFKIIRVRRGSLFEKLVAKGVSEELACRRQHMYNRLVAVLSNTESDDGD
jgi:hypothetical protein